MKRLLMVCGAVAALGGCASPELKRAQANVHEAQADGLKAHAKQLELPLLELELGEDGRLKKLVVGRQIGAPPPVAMPQDPAVQMVGKVVDGAVAVGSIVGGGSAAKGIVEATGAAIGGALRHMPEAVVVEQPAPAQIPGAPPAEIVVVPPAETVVVEPKVVVVPGGGE